MHEYLFALLGGAMIGVATVMLMATHGRTLGVSGILKQLLPPFSAIENWRISFVLGVLAAPFAASLFLGYRPVVEVTENILFLVAGGLLVGVGTVMGNGCTSGHGVCGLSRLSTRSIVATVVFMFSAIITVLVVRTATGVWQ